LIKFWKVGSVTIIDKGNAWWRAVLTIQLPGV